MEFDFSKQVGKRISIKEKSSAHYVNIEDILYIECVGYLSTLFLIEGKLFCVSKLLKEYEKNLSEYSFLRVNYYTLVNPKHISDIITTKEGQKRIKVGEKEIDVSRRRAYLFKKKDF